jgi:O-acetyl-ADP-ribose deacetylase (regulator of RNase III)
MNIVKSAETPLLMGVSVDFAIVEAFILIHFWKHQKCK